YPCCVLLKRLTDLIGYGPVLPAGVFSIAPPLLGFNTKHTDLCVMCVCVCVRACVCVCVCVCASTVESTSPTLLPPDNILERSFFIRMKSTLTKRGVHIKSSGYKVIHVTGRLRIRMALTHSRSVPIQIMGMVVVAHALPPPTINEVRIDCQMFVTRVHMDLNIVYCENSDIFTFVTTGIYFTMMYSFIHKWSRLTLIHSILHLYLINKGQCVTKYYRWIQKSGGYIWIQSSATIAINAKNGNEKNIIWVNYVLSNPEYKDTPMDIAQLPNLPEKASESSETSDSESESKDNSEDNENSKWDRKGNQTENTEDPETDSKKQQQGQSSSEQEMRRQEEGDSSSNPESQESEDDLEPSDCEVETKEGRLGRLGDLHIKVEHYVDGNGGVERHDSFKDCDSATETLAAPAASKQQKRKKRRKKQKWDGSRPKRLCLSSATPSSNTFVGAVPLLPPPSPASASVLKIKTEMSEPINFDNDSIIWNYPPNREISRNESPYSMTKPVPAHDTFPSPQPGSLQVSIPDSVATSLAPPSGSGSSSDPLSPPLSASPRDNQQGQSTPTTSSSSVLYTRDLEALQRLQAGNVALPLVQRVTGTLATTSTAASRVYTTGTIRYAPADVTLAMQAGANLLPNNVAHAMNFVDVNGSPGFGIDPKTPMEMLYHHVHRLNMAGPFGGTVSGASLTQMPAANVFTTAEGLFSTLPFPVYSNGIHTTQTLERKDD
uniref:Neuronal PAS domain protein 3 n=1 Tax=Hucho hucho TaxID=62062 RepID=A0A4W5RH66_9TELE